MTRVVTGDAFDLGVTLTKNKQPFEIPTGTTIKAALVARDRKSRLTNTVDVSLTTPGTDVTQALIIVRFMESDTAPITRYGPALLEINMTDPGGVKHPSWYVDVLIVQGQIL